MENLYPYEKLGLFYLGRERDVKSGTPLPMPLLYPSSNLTTHGVIIGMTGSGKTGLGIALIEEAIMDDIPAIVIDPKGDMGNLLLAFPECRPQDFFPWIDPAEAARKAMTAEEMAAKTSAAWKAGLAAWGQGTQRIGAMRAKTQMTIFTPGSSAGVGVSVLGNLKAPAPEVADDIDTLNSLVSSTVTSLLALVDITGDALRNREHILVSSLFLHHWRAGRDLSLEDLIGGIVKPPFHQIGVFPLDTYYPQPERMALAMRLNNILASPAFAAWTRGEPLDIQRMLYTPEGRPRTAIFSIAHLSEAQRMFFVTVLLNQCIGWMRRQQGTSALRALIYMDEIFGYFPPTADPPSKKPMLLLLKQARAYGIGVVLATQNPVDLDYKGLANIGSWFVGRLQTRQDQERVLAGIVGASDGKLDAGLVKRLLANMKGRQFLLNSAHLDTPLLFETRWVMSYLKGPITQNDIEKLMQSAKAATSAGSSQPIPSAAAAATGQTSEQPPVLAASIEQRYHLQQVLREAICFEPWLAASARLRWYNAKRNIDGVETIDLRLHLDDTFTRPDWQSAAKASYALDECGSQPPAGSRFCPLPGVFGQYRDLRALEQSFADYLYHNRALALYRVKGTSFESRPGEPLGDFKVRFGDHLRSRKSEAVEKLRQKYRVQQDRLQQKRNAALDRVGKEQSDVRTKTADSLISFGAAMVGAFLGRKAISASTVGRAATGVRGMGRVAKEKRDVQRAEQDVAELQKALEDLAIEVETAVTRLAQDFSVDSYEVETLSIKPRRSDIFDIRIALLWEMVA